MEKTLDIETDEEILSFVDCLIKNTNPADGSRCPFYEKSETFLYVSLIALLRDWFPEEDYSLSGLLKLLAADEVALFYGDSPSPLDLLFLQIEEGKKYIPCGTGGEWVPSVFQHNRTGLRPGDVGGVSPEDDFALGNYKAFKKSAAPETLKSIIISCNVRLRSFDFRELEKDFEGK